MTSYSSFYSTVDAYSSSRHINNSSHPLPLPKFSGISRPGNKKFTSPTASFDLDTDSYIKGRLVELHGNGHTNQVNVQDEHEPYDAFKFDGLKDGKSSDVYYSNDVSYLMELAIELQDNGKLEEAENVLRRVDQLQQQEEMNLQREVSFYGSKYTVEELEKGSWSRSRGTPGSFVGSVEEQDEQVDRASHASFMSGNTVQNIFGKAEQWHAKPFDDAGSVASKFSEKMQNLRERVESKSSTHSKEKQTNVPLESPLKVENPITQTIHSTNEAQNKPVNISKPAVKIENVQEALDDEEVHKIIMQLADDNLFLPSSSDKKTQLETLNEQLRTKKARAHAKVQAAVKLARGPKEDLSYSPGPTPMPTQAYPENFTFPTSSNKEQSDPANVNLQKIVKDAQNERRMVTKSGYLLKAPRPGNKLAQWRKRYFILTGRFLLYFKAKSNRTCSGLIELTGSTVEPVVVSTADPKRPDQTNVIYEIRIREKCSNRIYRLRAEPDVKYLNKLFSKQSDDERVLSDCRQEVVSWAGSLKNNMSIANDNKDMVRREVKKQREVMTQERAKKESTLLYKLLNRKTTSKTLSPQHVTYFNRKDAAESGPSKAKKTHAADWVEESPEGDAIDKDCTQRHFAPTINSGAPTIVGQDVGRRYDDEEINIHYKILGVTPTATDDMIKKCYRKLARDFHPDKNPDLKPDQFAKIARAFDVLKFKDKREEYDNCERVKELLRRGIIMRVHRHFEDPSEKIIFTDAKFLNLYMQDVDPTGTNLLVLRKGFRHIELRFVTHVYSGFSGFEVSSQFVSERTDLNGLQPPVGREQCCLTLHGDRLGQQDWNLELGNSESQKMFLDGMRKLRCDYSELFRQRLEEMKDKGFQ